MKIKELTDTDRADWDRFVGANAHGDVLQAWEWGKVKSADRSWFPFCLAVTDDDGAIVAGSLVLRRVEPVIGAFYYAPRGPIVADWSRTEAIASLIDAIRQRAKTDNAAFLKIDPAVPVENEAVPAYLAQLGFVRPQGVDGQGFGGTQPQCVMALDIAGKSEEELLAGCKAQCRRNIRKSQKFGVEVISDTSRDDIAPFYELLAVTAERDGFKVRGKSYYETLWDNLALAGMAKLFLTRYEGQYLSGALCFVIGDKCWYVYGASSNENRDVMPNYAMQWAMIRWAQSIGCSIYDFRGVSPRRKVEGEDQAAVEAEDHLQGLNRFKEGFGAQYVEYIGEFDLPFNKIKYWAWNSANKPAVKSLIRKVRR